ncbi:MAG TPA: ABC transporter substrate-binding protein [Chloroflexota bacterium]|nr:ABC transporter substrate-binding protein [Chloroflexota bacterium]
MSRIGGSGARACAPWVLGLVALVAACTARGGTPTASSVPAGGAASAGATAQSPPAGPPGRGPAAASAPAPATVRVATQGRPDQAAFQLALDRGYFTAQGIEVEPVPFSGGAEMVPALATNQIQVGNGAPSIALYNALNRGVEIRMVADYAHVGSATDTTLAILVRKDLWDAGTVRSMADLRGRLFANGSAPGTVADRLYYGALAKEGLSGDDVQVQYMPLPDIFAALANSRADAGVLTEPLVTQAEQQGFATVLYPAGAVIPGGILSVLQYSAQFAAEQPDVGTRFMVGYLQGVRDYHDAFILKRDRQAAIDILARRLSVKDPHIWETYQPTSIDLNGAVNVDDLREAAAFFAQHGGLDGPIPDFSRIVDPRFADAAVQVLGRR